MDWLVGRSEMFDFLVALFATNMLLKAAVIGATMAAAWSFGRSAEQTFRQRRRMVLVVLAAICAGGYARVAARLIAYPRPVVLTQQTLRFEGERLAPYRSLNFGPPAEPNGRKRMEAIWRGVIEANDWESFPSDQAAFFGALSLGLLWVNLPLGWIATGWTFLVIFPAKLLRGANRPSDLFAGLAIALLALFLWSLLERNRTLAALTATSLKYNLAATALFFLIAFEAATTLTGVQGLAAGVRNLLAILRS